MILDKREHKRKEVHGEVEGSIILVEYLQIIDLSLSGMRFSCFKRINTNSAQSIKIKKDNTEVRLKGTVVRSTFRKVEQIEGKHCSVYEVAVNFAELSVNQKKTLHEIISFLENEQTI